MKFYKLLLCFLVTSFMLSCSSEEFNDDRLIGRQVSASIADMAETRTSLGDGGKVLWLSGDDISLISKFGYHNRYVVSGAVNSSSTDFSYDDTAPEIDLGIVLPSHYAVYPYSSAYTVDDDLKTLSIDVSNWALQNYTAGTFEDDKAIMTAKSDNMKLLFYNAYSLLNIQLNAQISGSFDVSYISVASANHALNGTAVIDMSADKPQLECISTSEGNKINQLSFASPIRLTKSKTNFYLLVPAATYESGDLTISVKGKNLMDNEDFEWSYTTTYPVECFRSQVTTLWKEFAVGTFSGSTGGDNITGN